jgi:hypothetical protein
METHQNDYGTGVCVIDHSRHKGVICIMAIVMTTVLILLMVASIVGLAHFLQFGTGFNKPKPPIREPFDGKIKNKYMDKMDEVEQGIRLSSYIDPEGWQHGELPPNYNYNKKVYWR